EMKLGCYLGMFAGCTALERAPELPAVSLEEDCYKGMFRGCTGLRYLKVHFTSWLDPSYSVATSGWTDGVGEEGTFVCPEALPVEEGTSGVPEGWRIKN
ncbi:MAG: hypothetical protein J6U08_07350, partial [Paludibacteraceae bacterium]|nr:hypothetical protein [Paludibacteraceae bacterium]